MKKRPVLRYFLFMLPAVLIDIWACKFLATISKNITDDIPLLVALCLVNLIAYHIFMVPSKVKERLRARITGADFMEDAEDFLSQLINEEKKRQAALNGLTRAELVQRELESERKLKQFKLSLRVIMILFYVYIALLIVYDFSQGKLQLSVICVEYMITMILASAFYLLNRRTHYWRMLHYTLHRCVEKCGDSEVFEFDDEI